MTKPSPETLAALNVRIAALTGWQPRPHPFGCDMAGNKFPGADDPPNFTGSRDAAVSAVLQLIGEDKVKQVEFTDALNQLINGSHRGEPGFYGSNPFLVATADAALLCIALDRTLSPSPIC